MLLREFIYNEIVEAVKSEHSEERLALRLTSTGDIYLSNNYDGATNPIGTYTIPQRNKDEAKANLKLVEDMTFKPKKSYLILLTRLFFKPEDIKFKSGFSYDNVNQKTNIYIKNPDKDDYSGGNALFALVEDNVVTTIMWIPNDEYNLNKKGVDYIVKNIKNFTPR